MDRTYLTWPFFEPRHRELAAQLAATIRDEIESGRSKLFDLAREAGLRILARFDAVVVPVRVGHPALHVVLEVRDHDLIENLLVHGRVLDRRDAPRHRRGDGIQPVPLPRPARRRVGRDRAPDDRRCPAAQGAARSGVS